MKILVVGTGAREHAIAYALAHEARPDGAAPHELHAAPGNPGIAALATLHPVDALDGAAVAGLATSLGADLVVVGPEAPLVAGVADAVRSAGVPVFGPGARAARLEGSKAFAKDVMAAAGVPTARAHVCTDLDRVAAALDDFGAPYVVKDDGLAAGKGVVVTSERAEALDHARACLDARGGDGRVVIEEFLDGPEVSLFCVCDGTDVVPLAPAQDFKRALDGDAGPNTGGMGAYSPLPWAPEGLTEEVVARIAQPTVDEMARRGTPFSGVLYVGLALTSRGTRVVEFNARFGDPETQVVLSRLRTPLSSLLLAAAEGRLAGQPPLEWSDGSAVTVVVASQGYPAAPRTGDRIDGVAAAAALDAVHVLHAGTALDADGALVSAGGRVLSVVGQGADLGAARERAYAGVARISLAGSHHRTDIAARAAAGDTRAGAPSVLELPGWRHVYSGKVRDLYEPDLPALGGVHPLGDVVLVVASDRVSAYDHPLSPPVPDKGVVLTQLSLWWFEQLGDVVANHVVSTEVSAEPGDGLVPDVVAGRAMVCRRLDMFPVECVVRGYLTGSGLVEYRAGGAVCGVRLPEGLVDGSRLPEPIFTPATKAEQGEHDENVSFEVVAATIGADAAERLRELSLAVYGRAERIARERGVVLADTKLEFGVDPTSGEVVLGDEVLTPDSSRFWPADQWQPGRAQPSFDKQFVRDWLTSPASGWDRSGDAAPPMLPDDVVERTRDRYLEAFERITGAPLS
ncbi:phosphoribosylamine--glycine ligase [Cellulomonas sp. PhB143]|uniref:phosphoribosylamine--glycine ligase n=1 Tax=Cellulomonas sp. PhB143 TaxID=2485186 RepID=UPI000F469C28|nr:phosphoribosylamine--glycine ligase [Cellulomonas sp. PhB143]ROS76506.1 phosphoribosylaminoimidazole-succinocarboxamide synthase /phosphoribosylamine--glycine ligase [Cellulomonas sp. PhB143]